MIQSPPELDERRDEGGQEIVVYEPESFGPTPKG